MFWGLLVPSSGVRISGSPHLHLEEPAFFLTLFWASEHGDGILSAAFEPGLGVLFAAFEPGLGVLSVGSHLGGAAWSESGRWAP